MKKILIIFGLVLLILPIASWAVETSSSKHILDNGMTVVLNEMPSSPTISIYLLVKTGSANEGKYLGTGVSHFVEHMLFKGTKKRAVGTIPAEVKAIGGKINASTGYDFTIYTLDVPFPVFAQGLDIISDMVMNSVFDPEEVKKERDVIFGEMRMMNDRPERKLGDLLFQSHYIKHPYKHPVIGYVPLFGQISQEQLLRYFKANYIPNNMVLSIAGHFQSDQVMPLVEKVFKDYRQQPYPLRNLPLEPLHMTMRRVEVGYPSQTSRLSLAYQGVSLFDKDMVALDVLADILGQGESSRLYVDVYKKQKLVNAIDASNFTPIDKGVFDISAEFEHPNVDQVIDAIKKDINEIKQKGVKKEELDKAIHQISSELIFGRQVSSSVAYNAAVNESSVGEYDIDRKYLLLAKNLRVEDIQRVAREYLIDERSTVVILRPEKDLQQMTSSREKLVDSEIFKEVLPNGLKILLKEDHSLPIASFFVALRAGSREESEEFSGLNQLTADLLIKGAGSLTSDKIAQQVESRGASLSSSGGYNSMSVRINFLAEDLKFAIDIVEACIKNPKFNQTDFEIQKQLEIANVKQQDDSIIQTAVRQVLQILFIHHPLRLDISGTVNGLEKISRQQVVDFYHKFFTADHMVVGLYGDIKKEEALEELKKRFSVLPRKDVPLSVFHEDFPQAIRQKVMTMDKEQAAVLLAVRAPDIYDPDRAGMEIISSILGSSLNGRLFVKIREELGRAYTLGASYLPSLDAGMIMFYVLTTDDQVDRVKDVLSAELTALMNVAVAPDELKAAKSSLKTQFAIDTQTVSGLVSLTAFDELYGLGYDYYKSYPMRTEQVTSDDLLRIARKYLEPSRGSWVIIKSERHKKP